MTRPVEHRNSGLSRRRFLAISAAAVSLAGRARAAAPVSRWNGYALGGRASMTLVGVDETDALNTFADIEAEVACLEDVFSLYRAGSALSRLNRDGRLVAPPADLVRLMRLSEGLYRATAGAFDPTVQPLWRLHAKTASTGRKPLSTELAQARASMSWGEVAFDDEAIRFGRSGMALTFNGVAQGYIADRVAERLRDRGLTDVLVDMGEVVASGRRPDGRPWQAGVATPAGRLVGRVELADRALATSAPYGTLLDRAGEVGHILDPRTGRSGGRWGLVSVSAESAALADGLSTAFCLMARADIDRALTSHPGSAVEVLEKNATGMLDFR